MTKVVFAALVTGFFAIIFLFVYAAFTL